MKKIIVVNYDIRNGYHGPMLFKNKKAAMKHLREDFEGDLEEEDFKQLEQQGYIEFGRDCSLSISEEEVKK